MTPAELKNCKFVIYSHFSATGATEELKDWLVGSKVREVVYIAFPFSRSKSKAVRLEIYRDGVLSQTRESALKFKKPEPLSYLKDYYYGMYWGRKYARDADFFIGGDSLLALTGCYLRRKARIQRVVYYMIDYTPVRYRNRLLNALYYRVDKLASYRSDFVWPLTERTIEGRFEDGKLDASKVNWYAVPYGNHASRTPPSGDFDPDSVVFMGQVGRNKGSDLFVPIAEKLRELRPGTKLEIVGGGNALPDIEAQIAAKGLGETVRIHGFVDDFGDVLAILSKCAAAIAPYDPSNKNNFTYYADPGKLKVYLGCGLPVVLTDVPPVAKRIAEEKAGLIANYDAADIAAKAAGLLSDIGTYRGNAYRMGSRYDWDAVFRDAFAKTG